MEDGRPFSILSRRTLLKVGLWGAAAGGAGFFSLAALRGSAPKVRDLKVLDAHGYLTFRQLSTCAFPELAPGGALADKLDLARAFDEYLSGEPRIAQKEAGQALLLLDFGPLLFERRLKTFSHLEAPERLAHFRAWGQSSSELRRQVASGFRRFQSMLFYDTPEVWASIGYGGPMISGGAP